MSWELPILTIVCLALFSLWWLLKRYTGGLRLAHASAHLGVAALAVLIDFRRSALRLVRYPVDLVINGTPLNRTILTLPYGAILWLAYRTWQTLRKPVPELVSILAFDIPQTPEVCLAGIGPESATINWAKPSTNHPVQKYLIQVNGILVGESPSSESAITVTGLRPNHFYNIRVVAVASSNFRAASPFIRLQTLSKDGRPQLGNSRLPPGFVDADRPRGENGDENYRSDRAVPSLPTVEAAVVVPESDATLPRDSAVVVPGQRRNTVNRRHSPSVASSDQPQSRPPPPDEPEMSLAELNEKFEGIRKEIDDTLALHAKDEAEFRQQEEELKMERDRKRQVLKEKEEQTMQLKAMVRTTMEQMRAAEKERAKKEQQLKDKETKKTKIMDSITKLENEVERMTTERQAFESQKAELTQKRDREIRQLDKENAELQESCAKLEAELSDKGKLLQNLKAAGQQLPGADDEQWKQEDLRLRRDCEVRRRELHNRLLAEVKEGRNLERQIREVSEQLHMVQQAGVPFYNQPGSANMDPKRLSHGSNSLPGASLPSPDRIPPAEPSYQGAVGFSNAAFAPSLFVGVTADGANESQAESDFKTTNGPLSPSAQTLLPSNIFEESEETDAMGPRSPLPEPVPTGEEGPRSPASSSMSFHAFSSPRGSTQNLPFPQYMDNSDRISLNAKSSPAQPPATGHKIASFLSTFQRGRGAKSSDEGGPPIGTLKAGQSQSFPTATDENDALASRRRLNISAWMGRSSMGPGSASSATPTTASKPFSALRLNSLKGSPAVVVSDQGQKLSRPASIASTDLPRPSTDSGSIWGAPGDGLGPSKNRLWSPDGRWPSRSGSRRPSLQGSNALTTTLASADDEILGEDDLLNPETLPSQVGVIGSRPPGASRSMSQRLNPTAPTFMAHIFRKDRDRDRGKDRAKEDKGKAREATTPTIELPPSMDESPSDSRESRDTYSVHTQTSVSESHESLQLDTTVSNTASDVNVASASNAKDPENVVRKLFRKGSSGKFSLSSRLGKESSLFKKSPGSAANSDKNTSAEHRSSIGDADDLGEDAAALGRSYDSMASSPSLGPSRSKEGREVRMSSWRFSMSSIKKKGKEKESLEMDRAPDEE